MPGLMLASAVAALVSAPSYAAPCKGVKSKLTKCPDRAVAAGFTNDAKGKCHIASGPKTASSRRADES